MEPTKGQTPSPEELRGQAMAVVLGMQVVGAVIAVRAALGPLPALLQRVPDEAFYYFGVARNLSERGLSSFDGGHTLTTGYHPLWAWMLTVLAKIVPGQDEAYVRSGVLIASAIALAVAAAWAHFAWRTHRAGLLLAVAVAMASTSFLHNLTCAMEWSLVLALDSAAVAFVVSAFRHRSRWLVSFATGTLGLLAALARSDFLLVAGALLVSAMTVRRVRGDASYVWPSIGICVGTTLGFAALSGYNIAIAGHWMQGSARMKLLWASHDGFDALPFLMVVLKTVTYVVTPEIGLLSRPLTIPLVVIVAAGAMVGLWVMRRSAAALHVRAWLGDRSTAVLQLALASVLIVAGCVLVYGHNARGIGLWYSAHVTVPVVVALYLAASFALEHGARRGALVVSCAACAVGCGLFAVSGPPYPGQEQEWRAARVLKTHWASERIGISDTGIVGVFQGGTIINLDGLANDEIYGYLPDRLHCYLADKRITYFSGFGESTERVSRWVDYDRYSTPVTVMEMSDGTPYPLRRVDFEKLAALGCGGQKPTVPR